VRLAADLELAAQRSRAVLATLQLARLEAQPRVALGVEELGESRWPFSCSSSISMLADLDGALEPWALARRELGLVGGETAAEGRDPVVGDREAIDE
jgi:hypothetical protein